MCVCRSAPALRFRQPHLRPIAASKEAARAQPDANLTVAHLGPANRVRTAQGPDPRHLGLLVALLPGPDGVDVLASGVKKMR